MGMRLVVKGWLDKFNENAYVKSSRRLKRVVDILEKMGVASLAVGLFQEKDGIGLTICASGVGILCLLFSVLLTTEDR